MEVLKVLLTIYLLIGIIYALYTHIQTPRSIFWLPVNIILGPLFVIYIIYMSARGKKLPVDWW